MSNTPPSDLIIYFGRACYGVSFICLLFSLIAIAFYFYQEKMSSHQALIDYESWSKRTAAFFSRSSNNVVNEYASSTSSKNTNKNDEQSPKNLSTNPFDDNNREETIATIDKKQNLARQSMPPDTPIYVSPHAESVSIKIQRSNSYKEMVEKFESQATGERTEISTTERNKTETRRDAPKPPKVDSEPNSAPITRQSSKASEQSIKRRIKMHKDKNEEWSSEEEKEEMLSNKSKVVNTNSSIENMAEQNSNLGKHNSRANAKSIARRKKNFEESKEFSSDSN